MKKALPWLLLAIAFCGGYSYFRSRSSKPKLQAAEESQEAEAQPEVQNTDQPATVVSPLAAWMEKINPLHKTPEPTPPRKPSPSDHIAESPVGTSSPIVRKTFAVTSSAKFPFDVPAHAASPQLHGTYHSFAQDSGVQTSDESADIDLLLMNDQQYADFLGGHPADVVYSADSSHDQDVSFGLPATLDRPAHYYLVFRSTPSSARKKVVQADFRVDF